MKSLKIKVCGMRDSNNILELSALNPDFMGFIFYPKSKRYVSEDFEIPKISNDIKKVGVFVSEETRKVFELVEQYKLDFVQLHGDESPIYCKNLKSLKVNIIKAFGVDESFDFDVLESYLPFVDLFLFDTKTPQHGGSGKKFNWDILSKYNLRVPFLLSGGISEDDIADILKVENPMFYGIDVNSRFEIEPAHKDIEKLKGFINQARS